MTKIITFSRALLLLISLGLLAAGCKSPRSLPPNRLASVTVKDRTRPEIETAIRTVFEKHGYELKKRDADALTFEKSGTFMNGLVYGDWYSGSVTERINVYCDEPNEGRTVVDCNAYMVQEPDDPFFQTERKAYKTRRHIYQRFLNEVVDALRKAKSK